MTFLKLVSEEMEFVLRRSIRPMELSKVSSVQQLFQKARMHNAVVLSRDVKVVKWKQKKKRRSDEQENQKPKYYLTVPSSQIPRKRKFDPLKRGDLWCRRAAFNILGKGIFRRYATVWIYPIRAER